MSDDVKRAVEMLSDLFAERQARRYTNMVKQGYAVDVSVLESSIDNLVKRNLARCRAMRGMRRDIDVSRHERDKWKERFEALRKTVARAAQPETWEVRQ